MDLKSLVNSGNKGEVDIVFFIVLFILAGTGIAMCYSASAVYAYKTFNNSFYFFKKQLIWFIIGFILLLLFQEIDYRVYVKLTKFMLLISIILLTILLIPGVAKSVKGSSRWLVFGPLSFQPSEFVKIFVVIYLVKVFSSDSAGSHFVQLLIPILIIAVMFVLIMMQPDFSSAAVLLIVSVFILFVSGFSIVHMVSLFVVSIPMFYLLIYQVDYRKERLIGYLNPWEDRFGVGYHIVQSFIAFKIGGLFGVGLGNGTQKISKLPEPHTDFIFAVIAEETGLLGTILVVGLFVVVFWRGIIISFSAPDKFGKLLAIGLTLFIVVQAFINIGVVTGGLPTTGIPLPFISYGGSSFVATMIAAGIILNISRFNEINQTENFTEVWQ